MLPLKTEPQALTPSLSLICCGTAKAMPIAPAARRDTVFLKLPEQSGSRLHVDGKALYTETSAVMLTSAIAIK